MGAYAEYVRIINLVGLPSTTIQSQHVLVHLTLGDRRFRVFQDMYKPVTCAQTILTPKKPAQKIDRVLTCCWLKE